MLFSSHKSVIIAIFISAFFYCNNTIPKWNNEIAKQREFRVSNSEKSIKIGLNIIKNCDNDSIKTHSYILLGVSYFNVSDYLNAFKSCINAREEMENTQIPIKSVLTNNITLIEVYRHIGLYDRCLSEIESTLKLIESKDPQNDFHKGMLNAIYGSLLVDQKKNKDAISKYLEALKYTNKINDPEKINYKNIVTSQLFSELAYVYLQINDLEKAKHYLDQSNSILKKENNPYLSMLNKMRLGTLYLKTEKPLEVISTLDSLKKNKNIEAVSQLEIHEMLRDSYKKTGNVAEYEKTELAMDSITTSISLQQSNTLKNVLSEVEKELAKKEKDHSNLQIISIAGGIFSILIISLVFLRYKKRLRKEQQQYQKIINNIESQINNTIPKVVLSKEIKNDDVKKEEFTKTELQIIEKLDKFETKQRFLKKDLTLAVLAVELNTNASYLSDIINRSKNKNFNTYINDLRIDYIIKEIYNNSNLLNYKISYLADISGFNSHNTFALVFKRTTNLSPSTFIEQRRKEFDEKAIYK